MKVAVIGNYPPDSQASMAHYATMLSEGLSQAGCDVRVALPARVLNGVMLPRTWRKWAGYVDKYLLGMREIRRASAWADIIHICDHSNAVYVPRTPSASYVVTCHDLLAVRGALGEDTDCPASASGRLLQSSILAGLGRAHVVACVSSATMNDVRRLLQGGNAAIELVSNALHFPYHPLDELEARRRLSFLRRALTDQRFLLHVGSNQRRKNRETLLAAFAAVAPHWPGILVIAGQPLEPKLRLDADRLGLGGRIIDVANPSNEVLEALYSLAFALVFPSRFEGFGWPIIEAQACGCAVVCSSRQPLPEVAGDGAVFCEPDDVVGFSQEILRLTTEPERRSELVLLGRRNAARYGRDAMIGSFLRIYERVLGRSCSR